MRRAGVRSSWTMPAGACLIASRAKHTPTPPSVPTTAPPHTMLPSAACRSLPLGAPSRAAGPHPPRPALRSDRQHRRPLAHRDGPDPTSSAREHPPRGPERISDWRRGGGEGALGGDPRRLGTGSRTGRGCAAWGSCCGGTATGRACVPAGAPGAADGEALHT